MNNVIECNNLTHYYGEKLVFENLNFQVKEGSILGLLGKNGTGKTTCIQYFKRISSAHWWPVSRFWRRYAAFEPSG